MTFELAAAIVLFLLTVFGLLFGLTRTSGVGSGSFPNRGRFFVGLIIWILTSILAVFMSFPGYADWFMPTVYPVLKISFLAMFLTGFFLLITTVVAFPVHMDYNRREIDGRSDRIALLENIRQIAGQPYPITESFGLVLRELASFLVVRKGAVFLINPSRREMYLVAQIGLDKNEMSRLERFPIGQDIVSRSATEQMPFISGDLITSDAASRKLILAGRDITLSAAAVPLHSRDRSLGSLLVLSDKPFRFEKRDRMLLNAAAEALAGVVENNRLSRENQKLARLLEEGAGRLDNLRRNLGLLAKSDERKEALTSVCRYLTERYNAVGCRVVMLADGEIEEVARFESASGLNNRSESYRTAIIDAIMKKKMVILNQEARAQDGSAYIARSTLLCPVQVRMPGEYALLIEAPGDGLAINESFLEDIEGITGFITVSLNISGLQEADTFNQVFVRGLLNILRIRHDAPVTAMLNQFLEEVSKTIRRTTSALVFIQDQKYGYRLLDACHMSGEAPSDCTFLPGEGPIGKMAAAGEILQFVGRAQVERAWQDVESVNRDFFSRLFGEKGYPNYQFNIPVRVLDEVAAVVAVFDYGGSSRLNDKEKGILQLAAQLLSIKLSMARMGDRMFEDLSGESLNKVGSVLNRINNDLATIMGRAQLMARQPDISGKTRYASDEILKASESAADSIKRLQEGIRPGEKPLSGADRSVKEKLEAFLESRHVTENLYMFDGHRPVMLQKEIEQLDRFVPAEENLYPLLESVLRKFVTVVEEGEEVFIKSECRNDNLYVNLIRGSRDRYRQFDPAQIDFGDPDVMPRDIIDENLLVALVRSRGRVSFDRFGRRPTYISFRFPISDIQGVSPTENVADKSMSGLKLLAIDDQQMILDLLSGICGSLGLDLTAEQNPARGVEMFKRGEYDIVMVDLAMGEVSGWDIAREIKRYSPDTPVIMMTGWGMRLSPEETARGGVDYTLAKPFRIEQLTEIINQARLKRISS